MTSREIFLELLQDELPRFERVYTAVPEGALDYRPHDKSRTARELLSLMSDEAGMLTSLIREGELDMGRVAPGNYAGSADALAAFRKGFDDAARAAAAASDGDWEKPARLLMNGKSEWEATRSRMAWGFLLDLIHHRGQLSVYLRPMGGKVPAIYGPSADASS
jgi:uncharacterized damage-inducible protein DinB